MINVNIVDVEPVIEVFDFDKSILFYTKVLDFNLDWTWPETGKKVHGSVSLEAILMIIQLNIFIYKLSQSETNLHLPDGYIFA